MFRRFLPVLILLAVLCWPAGSVRAAVIVDAMRVMVKMTKEDRIVVTERFEATVTGDRTNHGMYRTIPLKPRFEGLERQHVGFKVIGVSIDGKPYPTDDVKQIDGSVCVYMRDQKRWLAKGKHVFWLRYEITQQVAFFEDHDELTWNAVGSEWKDGVGWASCLVLAPEGAAIRDDRAWTGKVGSKESEAERARGRTKEGLDAVFYKTKGPVREGSDFTVAVSIPKGFVAEPAPYRPEKDLPFTLLCAGLLLAVALASWLLWHFRGRDPETGPVAPLFYPPRMPKRLAGEDRKYRFLSAGAVNYLAQGESNAIAFTGTGFAALLLQLQAKGRIAIRGNSKAGYSLVQPGGSPHDFEPLSWEEERIMDRFREPELKLDARDDAKAVLSMKRQAGKSLDSDFPAMYEPRQKEIAAIFTLSWWCYLFLYHWHELAAWAFNWQALTLPMAVNAVMCTIVPPVLACGAARIAPVGWDEVKEKYVMAPLLGLAAFQLARMLPWSSPAQQACAFGILAAPLLFAPFMGRPTAELADLLRQIKGFAMYLMAAETDSLNLVNPPEEDINLYTRYLPYAVALYCEKAWGRRFASQLSLLDDDATSTLSGAGVSEWQQRLTSSLATAAVPKFRRRRGGSSSSRVHSTSANGKVSSFSSHGGGSGSGGGGGGGGGC
ncbi:MAG: DUF2207 domain-containing protein [Desulfovibrio sp.]|nr:DUF2207 domain-containing protein [Desulfovibrio sp.]